MTTTYQLALGTYAQIKSLLDEIGGLHAFADTLELAARLEHDANLADYKGKQTPKEGLAQGSIARAFYLGFTKGGEETPEVKASTLERLFYLRPSWQIAYLLGLRIAGRELEEVVGEVRDANSGEVPPAPPPSYLLGATIAQRVARILKDGQTLAEQTLCTEREFFIGKESE